MERSPEVNSHHLLYPRVVWRSMETTRVLRHNQFLRALIDVDTHRELHKHLAVIPLLDHYVAMRVQRDFTPVADDPLKTIDQFNFAIEKAIKHPSTDLIQKQLGDLTIWAMELQKPYIEQGLLVLKTGVNVT